jgi:hypothetical protein
MKTFKSGAMSMKKTATFFLLLISLSAIAQLRPTRNHVHFELGSGLNFSFNDSSYIFRISGMVQPYVGRSMVQDGDAEHFFNSRRSYLNFYGLAVNEKVDFFMQMDYSRQDVLLDAWVGYHPFEGFNILIGQKQSIANNREMLIMEDQLQYPDRSLLSTTFSRTGREFGVYLEQRLGKKIGIVPQVAVTSGDGRNSFGIDSRDVDLGGLKYAARLDVYPLGYFTKGNEIAIADLMHEEKLKFVLGAAASFNTGASEAVGEGHGDFVLYDEEGNPNQPDYRQLYGDVLIKYKGFSLLGEYNISTATNLEGTFKEMTGDVLLPTEISQYLALGSGYNVQLGYVSLNGYALDLRYSGILPEFDNASSVIRESNAWSAGLSKYFLGNNLKVQAAYTNFSFGDDSSQYLAEILFQVVF